MGEDELNFQIIHTYFCMYVCEILITFINLEHSINYFLLHYFGDNLEHLCYTLVYF